MAETPVRSRLLELVKAPHDVVGVRLLGDARGLHGHLEVRAVGVPRGHLALGAHRGLLHAPPAPLGGGAHELQDAAAVAHPGEQLHHRRLLDHAARVAEDHVQMPVHGQHLHAGVHLEVPVQLVHADDPRDQPTLRGGVWEQLEAGGHRRRAGVGAHCGAPEGHHALARLLQHPVEHPLQPLLGVRRARARIAALHDEIDARVHHVREGGHGRGLQVPAVVPEHGPRRALHGLDHPVGREGELHGGAGEQVPRLDALDAGAVELQVGDGVLG
mmetsp:Transcript_40560/g.129322  ORF Transcript_40560/g.129322 Transcript_40560/m.129322 type:complete len:272 (-) Transcript_40560:3082-3897(-)